MGVEGGELGQGCGMRAGAFLRSCEVGGGGGLAGEKGRGERLSVLSSRKTG